MTKEEQWAKATIVLKIIWAALLQGAVLFGAAALFSGIKFGVQNPDDILSMIAVGVAALALAAAVVLPPAISKAASLQLPTDPPVRLLASMWTTESILRWALLEGGALLCGLAFLVERRPWVGAAGGFMLAALALGYPSAARRDAFLRRIGHADATNATTQDDQLDHLRPGGT